MYERRGEEKDTLAKIDDNSVPCVVGVIMSRGGHHVMHIAFVSCRRSIRLVRKQPKGRARGLARSTLPSFDMVRETAGTTVSFPRLYKRCVLWCKSCVPSESAESSVHRA